MSKFETGANNHVTNDFVLTVVNDQDAHRMAVLNGVDAMQVFLEFRKTLFSHITPDEVDELNYGFANDYFRERKKELDEYAEGDESHE